MIAIHTLNNDGVINNNTITQNNSQTNYETVASSSTHTGPLNSCSPDKTQIIRLNPKKGMKIDLYRVIIAMHEYGFFLSPDGGIADQKAVFAAFAEMLGEGFKRYNNNLSESKNHNNDSDAASRIFDDLKRLFLETHD